MNQSELIIETQTPRNFAIISSSDVGIFKTPDELFSSLVYRRSRFCNVYAHDNLNVLSCLVRQYYPSFFYVNNTYPHSPLQLPATNSFYALQSPETLTKRSSMSNKPAIFNQQSNIANISYSYWGISALNGFCVCNCLEDMIGCMTDSSFLIAPWAQFFEDINAAYNGARDNYISRFYRRYESRYELLTLPSITDPLKNPIYIDLAFEERENRWKEHDSFTQLNVLYKLGF
jgi:hypothetical protein